MEVSKLGLVIWTETVNFFLGRLYSQGGTSGETREVCLSRKGGSRHKGVVRQVKRQYRVPVYLSVDFCVVRQRVI